MMSFMAKLCRKVMGEELKLPNIATWWCGQEREAKAVVERIDEMALGGAFGNAVPGGLRYQSVIGASMTPETTRTPCARRSRGVGSITSGRRSSNSPRRRSGATASSARVPFTLARLRRSHAPTAGPSCPAASAASRTSPTRAPCRWAWMPSPPMSGCWARRPWCTRRCCRPRARCASAAFSAICRAARPTICSGSAAISSAPRRCCASSAPWPVG